LRLACGRLVGFGSVEAEVRAYQEEAQAGGGGQAGPRRLSPEGELLRLTCSPQPVESGQPVRVTGSLPASPPLPLGHLCLLLYSSLDVRVAIIDLRRDEGPYQFREGEVLTVETEVERLDVIEGEYRIGLYLQGGNTHGDFLDLASVEVLPRRLTGSLVPYKVIYRGFVDIPHRVCSVRIE